MKEDKRRIIEGMFSSKLLVDDGDNLAWICLEGSNDTYLCNVSQKRSGASYQSIKMFALQKLKEYKKKWNKRNVSSELPVKWKWQSSKKFGMTWQWYIPLDLKKIHSLLPIIQNICLVQDKIIWKEGGKCFPVSCQSKKMTWWFIAACWAVWWRFSGTS